MTPELIQRTEAQERRAKRIDSVVAAICWLSTVGYVLLVMYPEVLQ